MNLFKLFRGIRPFVHPYRWLVAITLVLTLVGSFMAQVNAIVLDRTVDAINALTEALLEAESLDGDAATGIIDAHLSSERPKSA